MDLATLRAAMQPTSINDATLTTYLPHFTEAMRAAQITTTRRAAAWCSQIGHESAGLRYMAEIQTRNPSWDWDRTRYRGRGPIQLTWQSNYRKFGQWCQTQGYTTDPELFVNQPELVEQPKWGFLAASWYWLNGGPRPGQINTYADQGDILAVSRCINGWIDGVMPNGWEDRQNRWNRCLQLGEQLLTQGGTVAENRPPYNEFPIWSGKRSPRGGTKVDLFLLHTQEGGGGDAAAENLANWLKDTTTQVSYHYTISQASDGGVTVVDTCDTDYASWSVLSANARSINLCFAGSHAAWTRDQWMQQRNAIDVAAYLAVQDCRKYGIPLVVIPPPYTKDRAGISDHHYVTQVLGDGTHTDVGPNFPWDYFAERVAHWSGDNEQPAPVDPPTHANFPDGWTDRDLLIEILRQLRGPQLKGWKQLGTDDKGQNLTLVDAIAAIKNNRLVQP